MVTEIYAYVGIYTSQSQHCEAAPQAKSFLKAFDSAEQHAYKNICTFLHVLGPPGLEGLRRRQKFFRYDGG